MYNDEFDSFIYHDAIERCGLSVRNACAKVDHYGSWIQHAIVRLGYAQTAAEMRAAQQEVEQDIRIMEAKLAWDGQLMDAFRKRHAEALRLASSNISGWGAAPEPRATQGLEALRGR
ncbi:MAG TPA: hypothetical protein VG942_00390 [Hyphomonadaceae bacterium]|nr:hypothetical protein [Hyphomonadaceae bacterium]